MPQPIADLYRTIQQSLAPLVSKGLSKAQIAAESQLLLESVPDIRLEHVYSQPETLIADEQVSRIQDCLNRRLQGREPIQYLLGRASFYGLSFEVTPDVLIPRPETELLVAQAVDICAEHSSLKILDIGTGSGCIALSLKHVLREAIQITVTDISAQALQIAQRNAQRLGLSVHFEQADLWPQAEHSGFHLIVSNPPYVDRENRASLTPEVLQEPEMALFSPEGTPPDWFYQRLALEAPAYLAPDGCILLELGHQQGPRVKALFESAGFSQVHILQDYAGFDRILSALWPASQPKTNS